MRKKARTVGCALLVAGLALAWATPVVQAGECFTIVVGRAVSADGHVIMAHNEDDGPPQVVNHYKVPRIKHDPGDKVQLTNGGELDQVSETWAYIWSEMPELLFSDSYVNEWGVCVTSNNCPSREDRPELTNGGINRMLRRLIAQRARTAREGVMLAGALVERFGYDASGRTYTICDPDEGWLFCAVNGKHWLAERVPDDQVALIANTYSVREVNLADSTNFLAAADIIDYAVTRGWYDPAKDGAFDFAAVYANPRVAADSTNFCRQWGGLRHVAAASIPLGPRLPFSVVPQGKLGVFDITRILRDHYEGTDLEQTSATTGCPHQDGMRTICTWTTQTSFVVQLRRGMPLDIGIVYWVCLAPPCASFYVPFHFGIPRFPAGYVSVGERPSAEYFQQKVESPFNADAREAFWTFANFHDKTTARYGGKINRVAAEIAELERQARTRQGTLEDAARRLYAQEKTEAAKMLAGFSEEFYLLAIKAMERVLSEK